MRHKYAAATDAPGHTPSWRLRSLLALGVVPFVERPSEAMSHKSDRAASHNWYSLALTPGTHYIATHADFGNIKERVLWAHDHESVVQRIAKAGQRFAHEQLNARCTGRALRLVLREMASREVKLGLADGELWRCPADCIEDPEFVSLKPS